ncbi:MAG: hypothetical protein K6B52_03175 [Clostridiales bacterium]|nr:hypothetical protein [Clostridiales bacterium]
MKKAFFLFIILSLCAVFLTACGDNGESDLSGVTQTEPVTLLSDTNEISTTGNVNEEAEPEFTVNNREKDVTVKSGIGSSYTSKASAADLTGGQTSKVVSDSQKTSASNTKREKISTSVVVTTKKTRETTTRRVAETTAPVAVTTNKTLATQKSETGTSAKTPSVTERRTETESTTEQYPTLPFSYGENELPFMPD